MKRGGELLHVESKKDKGHTTTNRGGEGGDHISLDAEFKKDERHTTTNWGGKGGDHILLHLVAVMDKDTIVSISKRTRDIQ